MTKTNLQETILAGLIFAGGLAIGIFIGLGAR